MTRYVLKRILLMIPVVLGVAILIFTIMSFIPGDPAELILGPMATQQEIEAYREVLGLNDPFIMRLGRFLYDLFIRFDLGVSYVNGVPVMETIISRLPQTLILGLGSLIITVMVSIPAGVLSAVSQDKFGDKITLVISLVFMSMPNFWLAMMLMLLFSLHLGWLPSYGMDSLKHYILPWAAGAIGGFASMIRQTRTSMLDVIRSDYVTTARAKGCSNSAVIYKHALPNALIPIINMIGGKFAMIFAGSLILENVFSIPGLGQFMIQSLNNRDYPCVQGVIIFESVICGIILLLVDLAFAAVNPRIKAQFASSKKKKAVKNNG